MRPTSTPLTPTDLIVTSEKILAEGGYHVIREGFSNWDSPTTRLFEDYYSVVGVAVFKTCSELLGSWADLQGSLVEVISRHFGISEGKAWDGYLVLLTVGIAPSEEAGIEEIRRDTARLRKLVATGEELEAPADVEKTLSPLLPLPQGLGSVGRDGVLDRLPDLLAEQGIDLEVTKRVVQAFVEQRSLINTLHEKRNGR